MRLDFLSLRGRKFPNGNFQTFVFCVVKTQTAGKTMFSGSLENLPHREGFQENIPELSGDAADAVQNMARAVGIILDVRTRGAAGQYQHRVQAAFHTGDDVGIHAVADHGGFL